MNRCKDCGKEIDDKYKRCWDCNNKAIEKAKQHLETFTCANCNQTMYSMKWPINLCCNCYNYKQKKKRTCLINLINTDTINKTLEDDIHET